MIKEYSDLPKYIKEYLEDWWDGNIEFLNTWVKSEIDSLEEKTIIDLYNTQDGEKKVVDFINNLSGMIGGPDRILMKK